MSVTENRLFVLFRIFFRISALTVGGGLTMLPLLSAEFSEKRKWISDAEMIDVIAVVQSMPGIIAVNMAVMLGYRIAKFPGVLAAAFGVAIPPFVVILFVGMLFRSLTDSRTASNILLGVRASVCALISLTAWKMAKQILKSKFAAVIAFLSFCALTFFPQLNAVWVIVFGGLAGLVLPYVEMFHMKFFRKGRPGK